MSLDQLVDEALRLPEPDRAALAAALIGSLDPGPEDDPSKDWDAEIRRRLEELDAGTVTPASWSDARRRIAGRAHGDAG